VATLQPAPTSLQRSKDADAKTTPQPNQLVVVEKRGVNSNN